MNNTNHDTITDELRKYATVHCHSWLREKLLAIADRIDAAHAKALSEAYEMGRADGMGVANDEDARAEYLRGRNDGYDAGYAEGEGAGLATVALGSHNWMVAHEDMMAEHGWVQLPKDADGEPIHVGDRMTPNGTDMDFKVRQMHFNGEWSLDLEGFGISWTCPDMCRHYHAPTVEDLLREFGKAWTDWTDGSPYDPIAKYAKKLRLAESED